MLGPITLLALREKILTMEADRHGFGWRALPASMYVVSIDGRFLRHQALPRPSGLAATDPPHVQGAAYAAAAGAAPLAAAGVVVAACFVAELCPGCLRSRLPRPVHRIWHMWRHQPTVRVLVAVDVAGARYYLQRDRDDDHDVVLYISPPPEPGGDSDGEVAVLLYRSMTELLANWRMTAEYGTGNGGGRVDRASRCWPPGLGDDPAGSEGWAGLSGEPTDGGLAAEPDDEQACPAARSDPRGATGGVHSG